MAQKPADITDVTDDTPQGGSELATVPAAPMQLGAIAGDISPGDIRLPRLQLVHGVGGLSETYHPGDIVLGGDNLLVEKGQPLDMIVLSARQYWKEYCGAGKYDPNHRPASYLTEEEVIAAGGTTRWENGIGPTFNRAMTLTLLIKQPKDLVCGLFGIEIKDNVYAPAVWDVDKSAYRRVAPQVLTAAQFSLRARGLLSGMFQLSTRTEKINQNNTIVPVFKLVGHNDDETIAAIKAMFNDTPDQQPQG